MYPQQQTGEPNTCEPILNPDFNLDYQHERIYKDLPDGVKHEFKNNVHKYSDQLQKD